MTNITITTDDKTLMSKCNVVLEGGGWTRQLTIEHWQGESVKIRYITGADLNGNPRRDHIVYSFRAAVAIVVQDFEADHPTAREEADQAGSAS